MTGGPFPGTDSPGKLTYDPDVTATVFAFDRDQTVDVGRRQASSPEIVPLEWVRTLAHDSPHAVYALGNQKLTLEAEIPGTLEIISCHANDDEQTPESLLDCYPAPPREQRLQMLADLYPSATRYVVVDDKDLSDVDRWEHYFGWDFVDAVENGEIGLESL